jgi:acetyltransferase-like isoleucine patch superfamily enzyme
VLSQGDALPTHLDQVVTKDVPPLAVVAGNPARVLRILPEVPSKEDIELHTVVEGGVRT